MEDKKLKTLSNLDDFLIIGAEAAEKIRIENSIEYKLGKRDSLIATRKEAAKWHKDDMEGYPDIYNTIEQLSAVRRWIKHFYEL